MEDIYYVMPVDNSRLAPVANPRERRQYLRMILLAGLLLVAGLLSARGRMQSLESGYLLEQLEQEKQELLEANRKLRLEEASLGDPLRIDRIARHQLGMTTPLPNQIFRGEPLSSAPAVVAQNPSGARSLPEGRNRSAVAALPPIAQ
jgi:cell division protein FtsL